MKVLVGKYWAKRVKKNSALFVKVAYIIKDPKVQVDVGSASYINHHTLQK